MAGPTHGERKGHGSKPSEQLCCRHALFVRGGFLCYQVIGEAAAMAHIGSRPFDRLFQESGPRAGEERCAIGHKGIGSAQVADPYICREPIRLDFIMRGVYIP